MRSDARKLIVPSLLAIVLAGYVLTLALNYQSPERNPADLPPHPPPALDGALAIHVKEFKPIVDLAKAEMRNRQKSAADRGTWANYFVWFGVILAGFLGVLAVFYGKE